MDRSRPLHRQALNFSHEHALWRRAWLLTATLLGLSIAWCGQAAAACELSEAKRGTVAQIDDGETLKLTDGTVVRLIGAKAPRAPLSWRGDNPWPLVAEAKDALTSLASGAEVELQFGGTHADRHGNALAQVFVIKGGDRLWLQGELVRQGLARVYSFPDNHACLEDLLAREAEARAKRLGVWGSWAYRILDAADVERIARLRNSYQLVEGVVTAVGEGRDRIYLNFAKDWKTDFTVVVDCKGGSAATIAGLDAKALTGKRVRARGWVEWRNGPMIEASDPGQIELLPDDAALPKTNPDQADRARPQEKRPGEIAL